MEMVNVGRGSHAQCTDKNFRGRRRRGRKQRRGHEMKEREREKKFV